MIGLKTNAIVIIMVQILIALPVIQNMKRVMKICLEGDLANSQALFSKTSTCVLFLEDALTEISFIDDFIPKGSFKLSLFAREFRLKDQFEPDYLLSLDIVNMNYINQ